VGGRYDLGWGHGVTATALDYRELAPAHQVYEYCPRCAAVLRNDEDGAGRVSPVCPGCGWTYYPSSLIGALAVVEAGDGIVLVRPPGGTPDAPASLPGGRVAYADTPEAAAVRLVREQTGLHVDVLELLTHFVQLGTPFGPFSTSAS
jgi:NADH pyrophosphatase NudC (nudix superfamily)